MALLDQIIGAESGGNPTAANPLSSARGLGQFIASTWLDTIAKHRPDLLEGRTPDQILALRDDPTISREITGDYASDNAALLSKSGIEPTAGATYLAHFAGPQGAIKVLQADPATPVASLLGESAVKANPFLANMTAGDLASWASRKMGSAGPMPPRASGAHPVGAAAIPPAAAPMLPPQSQSPASPLRGLLSAPVQAASGNAGDALQSFWQALPAQQPQALPPMFAPPRPPPVDLRQLRQVFPLPGQAPGFLIG